MPHRTSPITESSRNPMHYIPPESIPIIVPMLFFAVIATSCANLFGRRGRHSRAAEPLLTRPSRFADVARERGRRQTWPFNARGRQPPADEETGLGASGGYGTFEAFAGFDGVQAAAYRDLESFESPILGDAGLTGSQIESLIQTCGQPQARSRRRSDVSIGHSTIEAFAKSGEGRVRLIRQKPSGKIVVLKTIRPKRQYADRSRNIPSEVKMLALHTKSHPNIVELYGFTRAFDDDEMPACNLFLAYCDVGDLVNFCCDVRSAGRLPPPIFIMHLIASMADVLGYLHLGYGSPDTPNADHRDPNHKPIIHCDIKLENIFLRWSDNSKYGLPDVVLGDFGYACFESRSYGVCGTPGRFPPEAKRVNAVPQDEFDDYIRAHGEPVMTKASDIYTLGAVLYSVVTCYVFDNRNFSHEPPNMAEHIAENSSLDTMHILPFVLELTRSCSSEKPTDRVPTQKLFGMSAKIKGMIADLYDQGDRMVDTRKPDVKSRSKIPDVHFQSMPADGLEHGKSSETPTEIQKQSTRSEASLPRLPSPGTTFIRRSATNMSGISGFSDRFCYCAAHRRSLSHFKPGPNCIWEQAPSEPLIDIQTTQSEPAGCGVESVDAASTITAPTGVAARAWSYNALLPSRFSDSSDEMF